MSSGTLRKSEAFVVVRSSFVVLELRTVFHPRRGPFGSAAPDGLVFRRNARWGRTGVTGTPRVPTRPDLLPAVPPAALRRPAPLETPPSPPLLTPGSQQAILPCLNGVPPP